MEISNTTLTPRSAAGKMSSEQVIVAVKAEKVITKTAMAWALTHVVHPGDCITLLAVFPEEKTGRRRFWGFPRLKGDCRAAAGGADPTSTNRLPDRIGQISESCSQMVLQFHDRIDVRVRIKVVSATPAGTVAAEAKDNAAKWVVLDKKLKLELRHCMDQLHCNIVVMKGSQPKVLRLNLECSDEIQTPFYSAASSPVLDVQKLHGLRMKHSTPVSSPEEPSTSYTKTSGETSLSSPDTATSKFLVYQQNPLYEKLTTGKHTPSHKPNGFGHPLALPDSVEERTVTLSMSSENLSLDDKRIFWIPQNHKISEKAQEIGDCQNGLQNTALPMRDDHHHLVPCMLTEGHKHNLTYGKDVEFNSNIRDAVSLCRTLSTPPPLCSQCQQKAPAFGKPPRQFLYEELEEATDGFSDMNFLAEGGFGLVYRGILRDGLVVAIKQLKFSGSQRDADFCREVRVLSCAQHRNVVLLIGFCVEQKRRLLVYEYICNSSLDLHLHGNLDTILDWDMRLKIAIGTARGLRYLHEDCRVGCIIHRDLRPHNILLTHDFEPLVADFGLARLHREWELCDEEQVIGTYGYLAPEYFTDAKVTEKVDIYAFGLVLLELITGEKTGALPNYSGQQFLFKNFHPLGTLEESHSLADKQRFLDPCLVSYELQSFPYELRAMSHAASLCLQKDPDLRPPMSKVLRILEGGGKVVPLVLDSNSIGSRSGHINGLNPGINTTSRRKHSRRLSH
ncbi:inactive protein kinase SELMODRAFT_444075-like [Coffea eugenioides]|uniref:inactive protein kinase SELMODRAFT_444075-like n=1 Tax=Coffea eugenioides TaxID=49369 RepID=UPI000F6101AC|nr:inactive protein kinase SELMODRAFT_444075-like [Coffea eugenioides]